MKVRRAGNYTAADLTAEIDIRSLNLPAFATRLLGTSKVAVDLQLILERPSDLDQVLKPEWVNRTEEKTKYILPEGGGAAATTAAVARYQNTRPKNEVAPKKAPLKKKPKNFKEILELIRQNRK
jgi:hypothetical protein